MPNAGIHGRRSTNWKLADAASNHTQSATVDGEHHQRDAERDASGSPVAAAISVGDEQQQQRPRDRHEPRERQKRHHLQR